MCGTATNGNYAACSRTGRQFETYNSVITLTALLILVPAAANFALRKEPVDDLRQRVAIAILAALETIERCSRHANIFRKTTNTNSVGPSVVSENEAQAHKILLIC